MARDDVVTALIVVGTLAAVVGFARLLYHFESRGIAAEARAGQDMLERWLAQQHSDRA